jgi:protocatechuate 3,4-dioxygenase beta subunit
MPKWLLFAAAAGVLHAAVIRGTVVEHQSGHPLARALVAIEPVSGTPGKVRSVRTNLSGVFEFSALSAGAYLVNVSRRAFAPVQYGQKRWKAAGVPVVVDEAGSAILNIRLARYGAITGTLLDENGVALPEHEVVAYLNTRPPRLAARGTTDDRGMYRIYGLEPGAYLIRTAARDYDEGSYLPTFARESATVDLALPVEVVLDQDTTDANVRPAPGRLFSVSGRAITSPRAPATVTLVSDMGSQTTTSDSDGRFQFKPEAPGQYEVYAQSSGARGLNAAFQPLALDRDRDIGVTLSPLPTLEVRIADTRGQSVDAPGIQILSRRKDLSGDGKPNTLRLKDGSAQLMPGRWDLSLAPTPGYVVAKFSGPRAEETGGPDGWHEISVAGNGAFPVIFTLSSNPGAVHGIVKSAGDPVPGAPVYLEAYDPDRRRRLADLRTVRTDTRGRYTFAGLAPGLYRILSTFEFNAPESSDLDASGAGMFRLEEGRDEPLDLDLYVIR